MDSTCPVPPQAAPNGAVRAALLLLEEIEAQPGQSRRMRTNAREVHDVLAPVLHPLVPAPLAASVPAPTAGDGEWVPARHDRYGHLNAEAAGGQGEWASRGGDIGGSALPSDARDRVGRLPRAGPLYLGGTGRPPYFVTN